ncbi:restriction endonuclease subunit S [Vreelandella venusta]|uniref:restriction endonuclease subunit S n=1 Tax=Vreelandella venusta TaxID=44935 RepID=UPI00384EF59F
MSFNEIFPNYPKSWRSLTLGELAKESSGSIQTGPFGSQLHASDYVECGIPSIMPKNISVDGVLKNDIAQIKPEDAERLEKYRVRLGDIVYSRRGDVEKCCLITEKEDGWLCGTGCLRVRIPADNLLQQYIHAYLCHPLVRSWVVRHAIGATMPNLNTSILSALPVLIPAAKEMQRIVEIWSAVSKKITLNTQINQTLEQMAQALFKSWFVDFDPVIDNALEAGNPIPELLVERAERREAMWAEESAKAPARLPAETRRLFPDRFEEDKVLGWVPKGWVTKPVSQTIEINPKAKLSKGTIAKYADMKSVPTTGYMIDGFIEKPYSGGAKFESGDVLLARITPCLENGKTALVDFLDENEVGFGSTEFVVMRGKGELGTPYVACLARWEEFRKHCIQSMVGSSGRQRIQNASFDSFYVVMPENRQLLTLFDYMCGANFRIMTEYRKQTETLIKLRDTLLPKLLSGELQLPEAEVAVETALETEFA